MLESEYFGATRRHRQHHRRKAITGIVMGLVFIIGAAVAGYYLLEGKKGHDLVVLLMLPGFAFSIWGGGHLARHRGYPTYSAYILFGFGLVLIGGLVLGLPGMLAAKTVSLIFVFATIAPTVILLSLPVKKDHRVHRKHRRESVGF